MLGWPCQPSRQIMFGTNWHVRRGIVAANLIHGFVSQEGGPCPSLPDTKPWLCVPNTSLDLNLCSSAAFEVDLHTCLTPEAKTWTGPNYGL